MKIIDAQSGDAIEGATVTYTVDGVESTGTSGSDGLLDLGGLEPNTLVSVEAEKQFYDALNDSVLADSCGTPKSLPHNPQVTNHHHAILAP